jgi:NADH-quinone oxidoreductase subunit K
MDFFINFFFFFDILKYNIFCILLLSISLLGILITRKNLIIIIMSIELMLLSISISFIFSSIYLDDCIGQIIALYILTIAAAETSIGLALIVIYYRLHHKIAIDFINSIKG